MSTRYNSLGVIPQSNGVRQGSPDSPVLFAALAVLAASPLLAQTEAHTSQPLPSSGAVYMDDRGVHAPSTPEEEERDRERNGLHKKHPRKKEPSNSFPLEAQF